VPIWILFVSESETTHKNWGTVVTFGQAIQSGFRNFATWQGRATRSEYWWWTLFSFLVSLPFSIAAQVSSPAASSFGSSADAFGPADWLGLLVSLALLLPSIAVLIRRLHDTDRSGGWFWFGLVPFFGAIVLFVFTLLPSTAGRTRFEAS
jgi:uncharacterized membrane protein YhaH (DUF805 family)